MELAQECIVEGFRLSPQQARLWLLQPESPAFCAQSLILLEGELEARLIKEALEMVCHRHDILRTTFPRVPGMDLPIQVVNERHVLSYEEIDLSRGVAQDQQARIEEIMREQRARGFDLERQPLVRASLMKLPEGRRELLLNMPSICADATTLKNIALEAAICYASLLSGHEPGLDDPAQYAQFSEWQNELLESEEDEELRAYWRKRDLMTAARLRLPFEEVIDAGPEFDPQSFQFAISQQLTARLNQRASAHDAELSDLMLACWQALVWRLTGESEVVVGKLFDGRKYEELSGAMGLFAKYAPVRCEFSRSSTLSSILSQVRQSALDAHEWQEYFTWDDSKGAKSNQAMPPFFHFAFDFHQWPERHETAGLALSFVKAYSCSDLFRVKLACSIAGELLTTELHYDSRVFRVEDIKKIAGYFLTLLEDSADHAGTNVSELQIMTESARYELLVSFNETWAEYPRGKCIHGLFEEQAAQRPDSVAIALEDQVITYDAINIRANRLAHYLRAMGCGPEAPVAICLERGIDIVIALLGILKAGGAYVPLDPEYPKERLRHMMGDSRAPFLLTRKRFRESLPALDSRVIFLDSDWASIAEQAEQNPTTEVISENLAYVIYTSGTTGLPKGVMIQHQGVVNLAAWQAAQFGVTNESRVLQIFSYSFDGAVGETFMALLNGATLVMVDSERVDPRRIIEIINRYGVTVGVFVPSLLKQIAPDLLRQPERLTVVSVGEACPVDMAVEWAARGAFANGYGPTEGTVYSHIWQPDREALIGSGSVSIGWPIHNMKSYILDPELRPAPVGMTGELYITGVGLARGYLNKPDVTAERFRPNGFLRADERTNAGASSGGGAKADAGVHNGRIYKTGDLAKYLPDGRIEFLGRIDHQVKLRGFRIELGEIESALSEYDSVREAIVLAREDIADDKRLVAYLTPEQNTTVNIAGLRRFAQERLPDYMLPSAFVLISEFPLTPNGKVDRRSLPEPEADRAAVEVDFASPRTPIEEVLVGIFSQLLNAERVGIHDSFFELGGHSLLATVVISRIHETFNVALPLNCLFDTPAVAGLAQSIEAATKTERGIPILPLKPAPRQKPLPLSFSQQRQWIIDQLQPDTPDYNVPSAFDLRGALNAAGLEQSLSEVVRRHEVLRTSFTIVGRQPVQVISPASRARLPLVDLSGLSEPERQEQVKRLTMAESQNPFDLGRGPLIRTTLLRLEPEQHVALFTIHHTIFDGWSIGVLIREVAALLVAFSGGSPSPLPELEIQYADFAYWQREWLRGEALERQLAYWKRQLEDAPSGLAMPTRKNRAGAQTFRGAVQSFQVPGETARQLESLSRREGVTLFMTLLASFKTLLYRYTRQDDIVVGTIIANRNQAKLEPLIGFLVNTLVLRSDLSGEPSFRELLPRVRSVCLEAYAHQDLPFEKLAGEIQPGRDLANHPLFQAMFTLQNNPTPEFKLGMLDLVPLQTHTRPRGFDFQLNMTGNGQGLTGFLHYNDDLFDDSTITRMISDFQSLLESVMENPDAKIDTIAISEDGESQQLISAFNDDLE